MIAVCWKWTGSTSEPDRAALEVALTLEPRGPITVITVGPPTAERALREAIAAGATRAVRIDASPDLRSDAVGAALASECAGVSWVICGDASSDRGSGSVPSFVAAELGVGQALGLLSIEREHDADGAALRLVRRLDGGRREVLLASAPAVLSVEGSTARLRRASLPAELAAQRAHIEVRPGPRGPLEEVEALRPYRPRARAHRTPAGDAAERIRELTGLSATAESVHAEVVTLDAADAAAKILARLRSWGYG